MAVTGYGVAGAAAQDDHHRRSQRRLTYNHSRPMLYEKLNPDMQRTVDEFTERIRPLPWSRKSDLLVEASQPFADQFEGDAARLASQGFLTAVLERLAPGEVDDPRQAVLFTLSLNAEHRAMAERYLAAHPEVRELLEAEGAAPKPGQP